jgi:hypothetical protein
MAETVPVTMTRAAALPASVGVRTDRALVPVRELNAMTIGRTGDPANRPDATAFKAALCLGLDRGLNPGGLAETRPTALEQPMSNADVDQTKL